MTREEVKKIRYEKKVKKALKCLRFRKLKNFLFWLTGVIVMPAVIVLTSFIGLKVVPIKSYTGGAEKEYVSEELSNKSILDVLLNLNKYGVSDIPGVKDMVLEMINGSGVDEFITINEDKLDAVRFSYDKDSGKEILTEVLDCISLNPELIGDAGTISMLNEYEQVPEEKEPQVNNDGYLVDENANPKLYYYQVTQTDGGDSNSPVKYARAFDNNGKRSESIDENTPLFYPAIKDVPIMDLTGMIDEMIARVDVGEVLSVALKTTLEQGDNQLLTTLIDALSNKTINDLDNIPTDLLSSFTLKMIIGDDDKVENLLGDFNTLGVFTWEKQVDEEKEFGGKIDGNDIIDDEDGNLLLNPALYYYFDGEEYKRVFDDKGIRYDASLGAEKIYYANLLEIPLFDMLGAATGLLNQLDFGEVLSVALKKPLEQENNLLLSTLVDALSGKTINDLDGIANDILSSFNLTTILGGKDKAQQILGDFKTLGAFTWENEVDASEFDGKLKENGNDIATGEDGKPILNPALYYYFDGENHVRAFKDDGVRLAPEGQQLVYANLLEIPLSDMLGGATGLLNKLDLGEVLSVALKGALAQENNLLLSTLIDALSGKTINDLDGIANHILSSFNLTTILGGKDKAQQILGDFKTLGAFTWENEVDESEFKGKLDGNNIKVGDDGNLMLNPALYYYLDGEEYKRVFDDKGIRYGASLGAEKIYYANLLEISLSEMLGVATGLLNKLDLGEVLSVALKGALAQENNLLLSTLIDALSGKTINDLDGIANHLLSSFNLTTILGGKDKAQQILGDFKTLGAFTWETNVDASEFDGKLKENGNDIATGEDGKPILNPALYYYFDGENHVRAFDDDGVRLAPEGQQLVYANLLEIPVSELLKVAGDTFSKLEIKQLLGTLGMNDGLFSALFKDGDTIEDFSSDEFVSKLFNRLSLTSLGVNLGVIDDLAAFTEWQLVESDKPLSQGQTQIDTEKYEAKLYYYVANPLDKTGEQLNDTAYARAFYDDGTAVEGVTYQTELYYAKLSYIGFLDMAQLLPIRLGNLPAIDLINTFGGAGIDSDDLIAKVLGDKTINQLGNLGDIYLHWVLPYDASNEICKVILQSFYELSEDANVNKTNYESITTTMLSKKGLDLDKISLESFIDGNTRILIAKAITAYRTSEEYVGENEGVSVSESTLSIGDIADFKPDYIALSSVANGIKDDNIKNIICQLVGQEIGKENFDDILVKDLITADSNKISLGMFITDSNTLTMIREAINAYRLSEEYIKDNGATGKQISETESVTVGDIADFKPNYIRLSAVASGMSGEMQKIICQLVGQEVDNEDFSIVLVNDLLTADSNKISLGMFIKDSNTLTMIREAINAYRLSEEYIKDNGATGKQISETESVTVGDIADFKPNYIRLSAVASGMSGEMQKIICQLVGQEVDNEDFSIVLVNDLLTADPNRISLGMFITDSDTRSMICNAINEYRLSEEYKLEHDGKTGAQISSDKITVGDIADFKPDYIKLSAVAKDIKDNNIKKIICQLVGQEIGKEDFDKILVRDLSEADSNKISLALFITDGTTLGMICDAINEYRVSEDYKKAHNGVTGAQITTLIVTAGDMADFKPDYIALSAVASGMKDDMQTLIGELVNKPFSSVLVKDLANASIDSIKLNTVLPYYDDSDANKIIDNKPLYRILLEATGTSLTGATDEEIEELALALEISALSKFDIEYITLGTAMPKANPLLKSLVEQITNNSEGSFDGITLAELGGEIFVDNINLSTVLGEYGEEDKNNVTLYKILLEASGKTLKDLDDDQIKTEANALKMSVLSSFGLSNVSLKTALSGNESATDNVILNALMEKDVKLGNIDKAINDLSLYEIFGQNCFTTDESQKVEDSACMFKFVENHPVYDEDGVLVKDEQGNVKTCDAFVHLKEGEDADELRANGEEIYYLHKNDGIWLLMCFEFGDIDRDITHLTNTDFGRPNEYYISENTLGSLLNSNQGDENFMSVALTKATLRQLMDAGMLNITNRLYYAATISDIVNELNNK